MSCSTTRLLNLSPPEIGELNVRWKYKTLSCPMEVQNLVLSIATCLELNQYCNELEVQWNRDISNTRVQYAFSSPILELYSTCGNLKLPDQRTLEVPLGMSRAVEQPRAYLGLTYFFPQSRCKSQ